MYAARIARGVHALDVCTAKKNIKSGVSKELARPLYTAIHYCIYIYTDFARLAAYVCSLSLSKRRCNYAVPRPMAGYSDKLRYRLKS